MKREDLRDLGFLTFALAGLGFLLTGFPVFLFLAIGLVIVIGLLEIFPPKSPKKPVKSVDNVPRETYFHYNVEIQLINIEIGLNYQTSDGLETGELIEDHSKGQIFRFYSRTLRRHFDEYGNQWGGGNIHAQLPGTFLNQENKKMGTQFAIGYRDAEVGDEQNPLLQVFENGDWVPRWNENNIRSLQRQAIPDALLAFQSDKIYRVPVVANLEVNHV